jgi:hypothetical protein
VGTLGELETDVVSDALTAVGPVRSDVTYAQRRYAQVGSRNKNVLVTAVAQERALEAAITVCPYGDRTGGGALP